MIHTCYIQIYFTVQNGQQGTIEQNFVSFPHLESSEHVDESDDPYIRISVLEEKNMTLEKQNEALEKQLKENEVQKEKQKEALEKQIEKLKKENEVQKQQLEIALSGRGVVQSKEEQFRSATSMQQVILRVYSKKEMIILSFSTMAERL